MRRAVRNRRVIMQTSSQGFSGVLDDNLPSPVAIEAHKGQNGIWQ